MILLKLRWSSLFLVAMLAACGAHGGQPNPSDSGQPSGSAPRATREALAAKPVDWSKRDPAEAVVPTTTRHVQVLVTPGWAREEHYVWVVSDGTEVLRVFRTAGAEVSEAIGAAMRTYYPSQGTPLDAQSFVMLGSFKLPPPPPPDPGGLPGDYVERVMRDAWNLNQQALQAELGGVAK
jgi:hypothetical protein